MRHAQLAWRFVLAMLIVAGLGLGSQTSLAHPLGNFSVNRYSSLQVGWDTLELHYLLDLAEIPTFQEIQERGLVPEAGHPDLHNYLARQVMSLQEGLLVELDGQRLPLQGTVTEVRFPPGAGGLPTLRLGLVYRAALPLTADTLYHVRYHDTNFPGRPGWQEIIATAGPGVTLRHSSVPTTDRSHALTDYPLDLLSSPPQVVTAYLLLHWDGVPGPATAIQSLPSPPSEGIASTVEAPTPGPPTPRYTPPHNAFVALVTAQQLSVAVVSLALLVALGLGAFHALEPGHGKTVVAAYLVGQRGTVRHALYLGAIVTASHTVGVYVLGVVTLYASHYVLPERLYPWLGVLSGMMITGLGGYLFMRRYAGTRSRQVHVLQEHHHAQTHRQAHQRQQHHHHQVVAGDTITYRELLTLGLTGGMVPCPAALVVLLSAISFHRVGFGLLLIVAFSIGLATVLMAIGVLMVYARRFMSRFREEGPLLTRWLPLTSAAVVTLFGVTMTVQALVTAGVLQLRLF
jgi:ABC-type nickel/cobalt efflux system permease component RcnA